MSNGDNHPRSWLSPCRGAALYALFGLMWIFFSDSALGALVTNPGRLTMLQTYKGCFFIVITATLVYWMLRKHGLETQRSNDSVRKSKASLELVFRALPLGVATAKNRVLTSVNDRFCEITGYSRDEIVGQDSRKFYVDEAEYERVGKAIYGETARTGRCFMEARWRRKDGRELNVQLGAAVAHERAAPTDIVLSVMDLTEQHEKETLYRLLFEQAHDALFLMNGPLFVNCNASALRTYGVDREQLIGASPLDFSPETQPDGTDSKTAGLQRITHALAGDPQIFEWRHLRADGTPFDAEISLNRIPLKGREYLLATARDVTERKQTLEALHASEESLSSIFRTVPTGIGVVSNRTLAKVNDRFCDIFGYSREELVGDGTGKLYVSEDEFLRCGKAIYGQLDDKGVSSVEARMARKDGREIHVLINSSRLSTKENGNTVISSILDITDLKQTEERLRASEKRFKALHNASFGGIAIHDKGVIQDCNQGLSDISGYSLDELIGLNGLLLIAEQSRTLVMDNIKAQYEEPYEAMGLRKNGEEYPLRIEGRTIPYQGKTMRVVEFRDITERKRAEARLRESERLLKEAQRVAKLGHWVFDIKKNRLDWSDEVIRIFGMDPKAFDATFEAFLERVHPADRDQLMAAYNASVTDRTPYAIDHRIIMPDGSIRFVHEQGETHYDEQGNALLSIGIVLDITERKQALNALQENEEYLASIFRCTPTGIGVVRNRAVMTANDRFCEIFGRPREEIVGQNVRMFYASEEEYQRCGREIYAEIEKNGYCSIEALGRRKDGREIHLLLNAAPLPADEGERAISLSVMDITERKKNEEALNRYKDELEEMVKERTEELTESNAELQRMIEASDDRSKQTAILNEMGELLQACETEEETYRVAVGVCAKLFPKDSGCLGILDEDNWSIAVVGSWGSVHSCNEEFAHNDCWAIRRGKAHTVLEPETDPLCNHVRTAESGTLCVPMNAQGKVLGMAHMRFDSGMKEYKERERRRIIQEKHLILSGLVERYAPSLVNLRLRESLREQSIRDRLTGLFNRRHMEVTLDRELARARRRGSLLSLVMIDVDHFKRFNDSYGHETGDSVLRKLGGYLISQVREEDFPCRYGGEELLLIMPECGMQDGLARAEDIRRGIEEDVMVVHNGARLQVTASIGVAVFPLHGENPETLIDAADKALYRAKEDGRNRVAALENTTAGT